MLISQSLQAGKRVLVVVFAYMLNVSSEYLPVLKSTERDICNAHVDNDTKI